MHLLLRITYVVILLLTPSSIQGNEAEGPSESECRPYIEKALQGVNTHQTEGIISPTLGDEGELASSTEHLSAEEVDKGDSVEEDKGTGENEISEEITDTGEVSQEEGIEDKDEIISEQPSNEETEIDSGDQKIDEQLAEAAEEPALTHLTDVDSGEEQVKESEKSAEETIIGEDENEKSSGDIQEQSIEEVDNTEEDTQEMNKEEVSEEIIDRSSQVSTETDKEGLSIEQKDNENEEENMERVEASEEETIHENSIEQTESEEQQSEEGDERNKEQQSKEKDIETDANSKGEEESEEGTVMDEQTKEKESEEKEISEEDIENKVDESQEVTKTSQEAQSEEETVKSEESVEVQSEEGEKSGEMLMEKEATLVNEESEEKEEEEKSPSQEEAKEETESKGAEESTESVEEIPKESEEQKQKDEDSEGLVEEQDQLRETTGDESIKQDSEKDTSAAPGEKESTEEVAEKENVGQEEDGEGEEHGESPEEEELIMVHEVPEKLRSREHMAEILRLNSETEEIEQVLSKTVEHTLRELKKLYEAAIKPLEILYKYRDLSNRHFGDPEIFSKPLILFMGPWSGGKSTIINYLLENEYKNTALRTGADPSPAYFNIVMWGEASEILDGTQLAADWTFSGLQKFGQVLLDRLRGLKLNHPLLEKVNIVEIPGILEIRKQVERLFPFNDACQWFIDRADIIFLVYDPSKLDIGPETEAILDQLKGREMQTRIVLNKADQIKAEELMRVQGTLIWNISPLMSSSEPPVMYSTSLWSIPYEVGSPTRLLHAQEKAFLTDLRTAIDKRVENKIAGARRFAVRVRNHAKMVDCYLTTYYNHKSFFDNKKHVSDDIIEHPQNYHIYEGLSTLTNISRYDLPDPEVYKDFFRLNPVYEFQQLSSTCTYFRGCPINRLDLAIAYDLPELIGKYKKSVEELLKTHNARK